MSVPLAGHGEVALAGEPYYSSTGAVTGKRMASYDAVRFCVSGEVSE